MLTPAETQRPSPAFLRAAVSSCLKLIDITARFEGYFLNRGYTDFTLKWNKILRTQMCRHFIYRALAWWCDAQLENWNVTMWLLSFSSLLHDKKVSRWWKKVRCFCHGSNVGLVVQFEHFASILHLLCVKKDVPICTIIQQSYKLGCMFSTGPWGHINHDNPVGQRVTEKGIH